MENKKEKDFWNRYLSTLSEGEDPQNPYVEASIPGDERVADELLQLYLDGKKTAGSGLVKDYLQAGDPLPQVGDYWIILDSKKEPRCIVKTIRVETHIFRNIPEKVAIAEGEGDLSVQYWKQAHRSFFTPYLEGFGIECLDDEEVVTEYYDVVYQEES